MRRRPAGAAPLRVRERGTFPIAGPGHKVWDDHDGRLEYRLDNEYRS